jgi:hypothetical protein
MLTKGQILRTLKNRVPRDGDECTLRDFLEQNHRDLDGWPSSLRTWEPGAKTRLPDDDGKEHDEAIEDSRNANREDDRVLPKEGT